MYEKVTESGKIKIDGKDYADDFKAARQEYTKFRDEERMKITARLQGEGSEIMKYSKEDGGFFKPSKTPAPSPNNKLGHGLNDLRNWQWIEARKNGVVIRIYLQAFHIDQKTWNPHVKFDKISIWNFSEYRVTPFTLPLSEGDLEDFIKYVSWFADGCRGENKWPADSSHIETKWLNSIKCVLRRIKARIQG